LNEYGYHIARELQQGRLVRPFEIEIALGDYWLTSLKSKQPTASMRAFRTWLLRSLGSASDTR